MRRSQERAWWNRASAKRLWANQALLSERSQLGQLSPDSLNAYQYSPTGGCSRAYLEVTHIAIGDVDVV